MADKNRLDLWRQKGLTLQDRFKTEPAIERDIDSDLLQTKLERGSIQQRARLKFYPSIEVEFDNLYAGTFFGTKEELVNKLFRMGYRNNPTAYVEITDKFGPDDGSLAKHKVEEDIGFPHLNIDRPLGILPIWNRVKHQNHVAYFIDGEEIHLTAHEEVSAVLQPVRHLGISESNSRIGIRQLRNDWFDEFGEELSRTF